MKTARLGLAAVGALLALALPAVAQANEVTKWNEIAANTVLAPTQPATVSSPPSAGVFMAMVQGAVYGAANAADRHGKPYLVNRSFPKASLDAAVATAAFRVIDGTFPAQHAALQAAYDASLSGIPNDASKDQGIDVGTMAADAMLAQGHFTPMAMTCDFGSGPGVFQVLPLQACDPTQWVAHAVPFIVQSADQFRTAGPYPLTSAAYAADVNEVEMIGSINSATRTPEQTHIAAAWQTNPAAGYNALGRRFVAEQSLSTRDSALMFAMIDLTAADAIINTWNDKYYWKFWRPIAAIRNADTDGNPATVKDGGWTPMFDGLAHVEYGAGPNLITPPYPEHPSGNTAYTTATMDAFRSFFGTDDMTFYLTSSRFPTEQRHYDHFSDPIKQVIEARIWAGIHFRNADVQAETLGREVEAYIHETQFDFVH
jgi:hypothetical protein